MLHQKHQLHQEHRQRELLLRPMLLWYLKVNQALKLLASIDRSLKCLPAGPSGTTGSAAEPPTDEKG